MSQKEQYVRDLVWVIESPSLLSGQGDNQFSIDVSKVDPDHLAQFMSTRSSTRVGRYFENLVLYWLTHIRKVEIVAESKQVLNGKETIGEIDVLFFDEQRRLTHWELAVKFYLYLYAKTHSGSQFIGPNAADTFERKMNRLFDHQLKLSEKYWPDVEVREPFVRGRIFYNQLSAEPTCFPDRMNAKHLRGSWLRASEVDMLSDQPNLQYRILRKPNWLASDIVRNTDRDLYCRDALLDLLAQNFTMSTKPLLVSQIRPDTSSAGAVKSLTELRRFFVVADGWPTFTKNESKASPAH